MKHDIAFLHTAKVHVETFGNLVKEIEPNLSVRHVVNEALLEDARKTGITPELKKRIHTAMHNATSTGAKVVVCTCSTIGGIAEASSQHMLLRTRENEEPTTFTSMRIDRAMADEAVKTGKRILVVAALESTLSPTRILIEDSARMLAKTPEIRMLHIQGAWNYFEAGNNATYLQTIAQCLKENGKGYDAIVLAQASMAKTVELCDEVKIPILSSPKLGVQAAIARIGRC